MFPVLVLWKEVFRKTCCVLDFLLVFWFKKKKEKTAHNRFLNLTRVLWTLKEFSSASIVKPPLLLFGHQPAEESDLVMISWSNFWLRFSFWPCLEVLRSPPLFLSLTFQSHQPHCCSATCDQASVVTFDPRGSRLKLRIRRAEVGNLLQLHPCWTMHSGRQLPEGAGH